MRISVRDLIGSEYAITLDDGQLVYDRVHPELKTDKPVELDFEGVTVYASPFFNAAIGQLLRDLVPDDLNRLLRVTNIRPVGDQTMRLVIKNSYRYYRDPNYRKALDEALETMSEDA